MHDRGNNMPTEPNNKGYAPPPMTARVSPAAPEVRTAAVIANISAYELPVKPRGVVNQQDVPCCVSCALAAAMEVIHPTWPSLAPLFHYYVTRYENVGADSSGALMLDRAIGTLTNQGICKHDLHPQPYTAMAAEQKPSHEAYLDGVNRRIPRRGGRFFLYRQFTGTSRVAWIRGQLRQNCPIVIGLRLPKGYPDSLGGPKGYNHWANSRSYSWRDPENPEPQAGGHCVVVLGYDDELPGFKIQDSQGKGKFDKGCWWMGYRVADSEVVQEVYSLVT